MVFTNTISQNRSGSLDFIFATRRNDGSLEYAERVTTPRCNIHEEVTSFNKTKGYRPGVFSVNPIERRSSHTVETSCPTVLMPKWNYPKGGTEINGYLASVLRVNGSGATMTGYLPDLAYNDLNFRNYLLTKAYGKAVDADMDFGMFFAEAAETLAMLRNPFQGIRKLTHKLSRKVQGKRFSKHRGTMKDVASQWLEYRYGISPMIKDAQNLIEFYEAGVRKFQSSLSRRTYREFKGERILENKTGHMWYSSYMMGWNWEAKLTFTERPIARIFYFKDSRNQDLAFSLGLNPASLGVIAWELVPLSFVVDWFVGIGDWLKIIQPTPGIRFVGNTVSLKREFVHTITTTMGQYYTGHPWVPIPSQSVLTQRMYTRETNLPLPTYPVVNPGFIGYKQALDSLSLIWQSMPKLIQKVK